MAIKYLDSRRIEGLDTDIVSTPAYNPDFSSNTGWSESDSSKNTVNTSLGRIDFDLRRDTTLDSMAYDLGYALSDTAWTVRFRIHIDNVTNADNSAMRAFIGMSDGDHTQHHGVAQDSIGFFIKHGSGSTERDWLSSWSNGASTESNLVELGTNLNDARNGYDSYIEIIRTSSSTAQVSVSSTDAYDGDIASNLITDISGVTGLRYFVIKNTDTSYSNTTNRTDGWIDNLVIYNGTTTNKPSLVATTGGWVEVGRKTISSPTADDLTITGLPDKKYFMILLNNPNMTNDISGYLRVGNGSVDTTAGNYSTRYYDPQLGSDSTYAGNVQGFYPVGGSGSAGTTNFGVGYMANKSDQYKMLLLHTVNSFTSGINPIEMVGKWLNSSQLIERISEVNGSTGEFNAGCELIVLGYDPDDTHTTNFWEQLADVTASGSSSNLSSGTITAKKYLWIQAYVEPASSTDFVMTFNNDNATSNGNYDIHVSDNGGTYGTSYGRDNINLKASMTTPTFINLFIVNNSTTKKLCIGNAVEQNTAGANSVPNRRESTGRWNNTSDQITEIDIDSSGGNWGSNSFIRVWGAD